MPDPTPTPTVPGTGATRFGAHYLETWQECRTLWYRRFLMPHPDGGTGLETRYTGEQLLIGSAAHEALATYYTTPGGWPTGDYDIEAAVARIPVAMAPRRLELESDESLDNVVSTTSLLIRRYHDYWGKGGVMCDFPDLQVLADPAGLPLVEREFNIPLPYGSHSFTARLDAVVRYMGAIYVLEHKTTAASRLGSQLSAMGINTQVTGQVMILNTMYPDATLGGVLANMLIKDRAKSSNRPQFERQPFTRTVLERQKFITDICLLLQEIDDHVGRYRDYLTAGLDTAHAAAIVFPMSRGACSKGFFPCGFMPMCKAPGFERGTMGLFRPRTLPAADSPPDAS